MAGRIRGVVKWFNDKKGFGFAEVEGEKRDIFIHYSKINMGGHKTLKDGQTIEFEVEESPKGPQALNISVV